MHLWAHALLSKLALTWNLLLFRPSQCMKLTTSKLTAMSQLAVICSKASSCNLNLQYDIEILLYSENPVWSFSLHFKCWNLDAIQNLELSKFDYCFPHRLPIKIAWTLSDVKTALLTHSRLSLKGYRLAPAESVQFVYGKVTFARRHFKPGNLSNANFWTSLKFATSRGDLSTGGL